MRGSVFVYSARKVQNAHCSTTRALPLLLVVAASMTVSVDDFVRLRHCGHFANFVNNFGYSQREMMRTGSALPHIVINAPDSLFCLLPLLEQRVVVCLIEADHERLTRRAPAAPESPPLPKAEERAQTNRDRTQQTHQ